MSSQQCCPRRTAPLKCKLGGGELAGGGGCNGNNWRVQGDIQFSLRSQWGNWAKNSLKQLTSLIWSSEEKSGPETQIWKLWRQNTKNDESGWDPILQNYCVTLTFNGRVHERAAWGESPGITVDRSVGVLKPEPMIFWSKVYQVPGIISKARHIVRSIIIKFQNTEEIGKILRTAGGREKNTRHKKVQ